MRQHIFVCILILISTGIAFSQEEVYLGIRSSEIKRINLGVGVFSISSDNASEKEKDGIDKILLSVLKSDLDFSLMFNLVEEKNENSSKDVSNIDFEKWKKHGAEALVTGNSSVGENGTEISIHLHDIALKQEIFDKEYHSASKTLSRDVVHRISDDIVFQLTGEKGISQTKIAFVSRTDKGFKELFVMDYDGFNIVKLTDTESIILSPEWSPSGDMLAFTSYQHGNPDIYRLMMSEGNVIPVSNLSGLNSAPAWSPDGETIAMTLSKDGNAEIYLKDNGNGNLKRLTHNWGIDTSPTWSPNGREIAYVSDRSGYPNIYIMSADGSNLRRLTFEGSYHGSPAWSPLGDRIAYVTRERNGKFNIYTIEVNGENRRQLTFGNDNIDPSWSPDGLHIIFSSDRDSGYELYTMVWNGTRVRKLTSGGGYSSPAWSPIPKHNGK